MDEDCADLGFIEKISCFYKKQREGIVEFFIRYLKGVIKTGEDEPEDDGISDENLYEVEDDDENEDDNEENDEYEEEEQHDNVYQQQQQTRNSQKVNKNRNKNTGNGDDEEEKGFWSKFIEVLPDVIDGVDKVAGIVAGNPR